MEIDLSYLNILNFKNVIFYIRISFDYDRYVLDYCSNRKIKINGFVEILNEFESLVINFNIVIEFLEYIDRVKIELMENNKNK